MAQALDVDAALLEPASREALFGVPAAPPVVSIRALAPSSTSAPQPPSPAAESLGVASSAPPERAQPPRVQSGRAAEASAAAELPGREAPPSPRNTSASAPPAEPSALYSTLVELESSLDREVAEALRHADAAIGQGGVARAAATSSSVVEHMPLPAYAAARSPGSSPLRPTAYGRGYAARTGGSPRDARASGAAAAASARPYAAQEAFWHEREAQLAQPVPPRGGIRATSAAGARRDGEFGDGNILRDGNLRDGNLRDGDLGRETVLGDESFRYLSAGADGELLPATLEEDARARPASRPGSGGLRQATSAARAPRGAATAMQRAGAGAGAPKPPASAAAEEYARATLGAAELHRLERLAASLVAYRAQLAEGAERAREAARTAREAQRAVSAAVGRELERARARVDASVEQHVTSARALDESARSLAERVAARRRGEDGAARLDETAGARADALEAAVARLVARAPAAPDRTSLELDSVGAVRSALPALLAPADGAAGAADGAARTPPRAAIDTAPAGERARAARPEQQGARGSVSAGAVAGAEAAARGGDDGVGALLAEEHEAALEAELRAARAELSRARAAAGEFERAARAARAEARAVAASLAAELAAADGARGAHEGVGRAVSAQCAAALDALAAEARTASAHVARALRAAGLPPAPEPAAAAQRRGGTRGALGGASDAGRGSEGLEADESGSSESGSSDGALPLPTPLRRPAERARAAIRELRDAQSAAARQLGAQRAGYLRAVGELQATHAHALAAARAGSETAAEEALARREAMEAARRAAAEAQADARAARAEASAAHARADSATAALRERERELSAFAEGTRAAEARANRERAAAERARAEGREHAASARRAQSESDGRRLGAAIPTEPLSERARAACCLGSGRGDSGMAASDAPMPAGAVPPPPPPPPHARHAPQPPQSTAGWAGVADATAATRAPAAQQPGTVCQQPGAADGDFGGGAAGAGAGTGVVDELARRHAHEVAAIRSQFESELVRERTRLLRSEGSRIASDARALGAAWAGGGDASAGYGQYGTGVAVESAARGAEAHRGGAQSAELSALAEEGFAIAARLAHAAAAGAHSIAAPAPAGRPVPGGAYHRHS